MSAALVAPLAERFDGVERIAVVRGGGLGDLLFALPAVDALAAAYPEAEVTLLGTPLARELLAGRSRSVSHVELLPPVAGVNDTAEPPDGDEQRSAFRERMRQSRFDLAVQLHGGGRFSNPFVLSLGALHTIGLGTEDAAPLERMLDYVYYQHEVLRFLEVAALAGAAPVGLEPTLNPRPGERRAMDAFVRKESEGLVIVHPGATDPRRRWPAALFAEVAGRLAGEGYQVIVVGAADDVPAADEIVGRCQRAHGPAESRVTSLAGRLSISELVGLLANAALVIGNDSGPRHLAIALGVRTVGIFWAGNLINAGPFGRGQHRVQLSWTTRCPVCGRDATQVGWTAERCEHDVSFVADVGADAVWRDAAALLGQPRVMATSPPRGGR